MHLALKFGGRIYYGTLEPRQQEDAVVLLLLDARAPVPRAGQPAVDARAAIIARAVEAVLEEIAQNGQAAVPAYVENHGCTVLCFG